jgi:nucleoid-associated protein YgaU
MRANVASQRRAHGFKCVVEQVAQRFTMFSPKGVPLRAVLTVRLKEYRTLPEQLAKVNPRSAEHTSAHVMAEGETLTRVAAQELGDPAQWRRIADANGIDDPLAVAPGTVLEVPPIR